MEPTSVPTETPLRIDLSRIAQDLQIRRVQVEHVVQLLDEGHTVPFIGRYRRERTGGLPEDVVRRIRFRIGQLRHFNERKQTILKSIDSQGKLTEPLREAILAADAPRRLEDLYLPFKPKKRSSAAEARDRGLEPAAQAILERDPAVASLDEVLAGLVNPEKQLATSDDVANGIRQIIAETISESADVRGAVRSVLWETGRVTAAKSPSLADGRGMEYKDYFQFTEPVRHIPPHRVLAINRGEKEQALVVKIDSDVAAVRRAVESHLPIADHPHREFLEPAIGEAIDKLIVPALEREVRRELTERAQDHAMSVFARNLRSLLLQPPLRGRRVLGIDPGFRTGCRLAVVDETGQCLDSAVIHPHQPQKKRDDAKVVLENLLRRHQITVVAIGNGTGFRETEELIAELIAEFEARRRGDAKPPAAAEARQPEPDASDAAGGDSAAHPTPPMNADEHAAASGAPEPTSESSPSAPDQPTPPAATEAATPAEPAPVAPPPPKPVIDSTAPEPHPDLAYVIVSKAGAGEYAASPLAREELPNLDVGIRCAISIARRLQDPLAELVKSDPQHIGVGLYQHDVHARHLKDVLADVVASCVNFVGVDLNAASLPLLRHVAGLNQYVARDIIDYRSQHGPFRTREQLKSVPSVSELRFIEAAGFLKVLGGEEPLDGTWIHPESYPIARQILGDLGFEPAVVRDIGPEHPFHEKARSVNLDEAAERYRMAPGAVRDLLEALGQPGRDPRDDFPPPTLKKRALRFEDLKPGMELQGAVLNVVDFGAFVDVGLKDSGLVHISEMASRYIKNPHELVSIGDVVKVWVLAVDQERKRVSLTMIAPGTDRRSSERRPGKDEPAAMGDRPRGRPMRGPQPPRGGRRGPPPRPAEAPGEATGPAPPRPPRQLPPRRPPKPKPLPPLTQAKKEGKAYLNTLGELEAFFKAREQSAAPPDAGTDPNQPGPASEPG